MWCAAAAEIDGFSSQMLRQDPNGGLSAALPFEGLGPSILPAGKPVAVQLIPELAMMICGQILCISHVGHGRLELGPTFKGHDEKRI